MKYVWRIVVLMLCTLLLCSCADSVEDGVLIVPSSRNLYEETSAVVTESPETEVVVPQTESFTAEVPMAESVSEQAKLLFGDEVFCDLLAQYAEQMDAQTAAVAAVLAYQQMQGMTGEAPLSEDTVFWTAGGSVWHVTAECSALAKSKSVLSGTEEQAKQAGKSRVCKRCGS